MMPWMQPGPKSKQTRNRTATKNNPDGSGFGTRGASARLAWAAALLLIPLLLIGPSLAPGMRLLPQLPAASPPLANEWPELSSAAIEGSNYSTADRLFPVLTDQLEARRQVRTGTIPTWDPHLGAGLPLFGGTIAALAYPPNWLALVLPPDVAAAPLAILSLFLAGLGMALFLRRRGHVASTIFIGALCVQASTWATANLHYFMKVDAALWLPWMLWSIEGLAQRKRGSGAWLSISVGLSLLAGFPPIAVFAIFTSGLFALARFMQADTRARFGKLLTQSACFVLLGLCIGAWQLLPTIEASGLSIRQPRGASEIESQALPIESTLGLLAPDLFGMPDEPVFAGQLPIVWLVARAQNVNAAQNANALEWNLHFGSLALLLAFIALLTRPRQAAFPLFALLLWLGFSQAWPGVRLLYHVPGLDFGAPVRALAIAWFLIPWLAAIGAGALLSDLNTGQGRTPKLAILSGGLLAGLSLVCWFWLDPATFPESLTALMVQRHGIPAADVASVLSTEDMFQAAVRMRRLLVGLFSTGALLSIATGLASLYRAGQTASSLLRAMYPILGASVGLGIGVAPRLAGDAFEASGTFAITSLGALAAVLLLLQGHLQSGSSRSKRGHTLPLANSVLVVALFIGLGAETVDMGTAHLRPRNISAAGLFPKSPAINAVAQSLAMDANLPGNIPGDVDGRALRLDMSPSGVSEVINLARPNLLEGYGLNDLTPYTVFTPSTLVQLIRANDPNASYLSGNSRISDPALLDSPVLDMLRVNTILSKHDLTAAGVTSLTEIPTNSSAELHVYHRDTAMPIARLVPDARIAPDDETALKWLADPIFDPRREVILAPGTIPPGDSRKKGLVVNSNTTEDLSPWFSAELTPRRSSASRLDIKVVSEKGGWLVLSEQFAPDWKVNIDGVDALMMRCDHAFRALWVGPGEHLVRTWYEPWSLRYGFFLMITASGVLAWLLLAKRI